jgi:3-hydroxyacyl-CoA dehydrogenase/enoyl-CoA hydratase/carnithine racemase
MVTAVIDFSKNPNEGSIDKKKNKPNNPLNPLSRSLRAYILDGLQRAKSDPSVTSVILIGDATKGGGGGNFSSGADLTEFTSLNEGDSESARKSVLSSPSLLDVIEAIDGSLKPIVAAIAGVALGGGLEVALSCHYRVSTLTSSLGLPEVQVGLIPGAGGTQRLPRCVGLQNALQMILSGQAVTAPKALKLGLVDYVADPSQNQDLLEEAQKWAKFGEVMPLEPRRISARSVPETHPAMAHTMLHVASLSLPSVGSECQRASIEAIRASVFAKTFRDGMNVEAEQFVRLITHPEGRARRHAFFATRQAQRPVVPQTQRLAAPPLSLLLSAKVQDRNQVQAGVIGAGTMGSGIATVLLLAGYRVCLTDVNAPALENGVKAVQSNVESAVRRRKLKPEQAKAMLEKQFRSSQALGDMDRCQLVVEAVVENLSVKRKIFAELCRTCPPSALLLSNTSTLSIDAIAEAVPTNPGRVAGWHFFSPAHVMKLVEIVRGKQSSVKTVSALQALSKIIGKISVVVGNCDGFCGNRLLKPYSAETALLLAEGATITQVDQALVSFGMALGPFQMGDLAGNDVGYNIRKERGWVRLNKDGPPPPQRPHRYTELVDDMVSEYGRLGQKVGKGFYDYPDPTDRRRAVESPEMSALLEKHRVGYNARQYTDEQIVQRVLYPLVNEGFKCLEEGIVTSPSDIDVVYLYGYGFPAWRGGPMHWADHQVGLPTLLRTLEKFSTEFPATEHYKPSKLLRDCVRLGVTVETYYQQQMMKQGRSRL